MFFLFTDEDFITVCEGHWPFGGIASKHHYKTFNEHAMQKLDWIFDYTAEKGMNIEPILWCYGVGGGEGIWGSDA
jgi:hypothetical protein